MLDDRGYRPEERLYLIAHQVGQRGRGSLVGNVRHFDARHEREQLARQVRGAADARRSVIDPVGRRLCRRKEIRHCLVGARGVDHEYQRPRGGEHDSRKTFLGIEGQVLVERIVDCMAGRRHQQRVAVGGRLGDRVGADRSTRAGLVIDDDRLAPVGTKFLANGPRKDVGATTGRIRHDDSDRLVWIGLCACGRRRDPASAREREGHEANCHCFQRCLLRVHCVRLCVAACDCGLRVAPEHWSRPSITCLMSWQRI